MLCGSAEACQRSKEKGPGLSFAGMALFQSSTMTSERIRMTSRVFRKEGNGPIYPRSNVDL